MCEKQAWHAMLVCVVQENKPGVQETMFAGFVMSSVIVLRVMCGQCIAHMWAWLGGIKQGTRLGGLGLCC